VVVRGVAGEHGLEALLARITAQATAAAVAAVLADPGVRAAFDSVVQRGRGR
jgi:hypothetical protein